MTALQQSRSIHVVDIDDKRIVTLRGDLNDLVAADMKSLLRVESHPCKLVVSLVAVGQCSSAAVGALIAIQKYMKSLGGGIVLYGLGADMLEYMSMTQLDKHFRIVTTSAEAMDAFQE